MEYYLGVFKFMNIFYKMYARIYQGCFRIALPILPYRNPKILDDTSKIVDVIKSDKKKKPLIITDSFLYNSGLLNILLYSFRSNNIAYEVFDDVLPNPTSDIVYNALDLFRKSNCDSLIAFGGGSVMDAAKAVGALVARPKKTLAQLGGILKIRKKIPLLIAIPTTCGTGSETTLASVITDSVTRHKYAINDFPLIPSYAVLDYKLILNLPAKLIATTGLDALTHAVEAYIGRSTTKDTRCDALEAIKLVFDNLLDAVNHNEKALSNMLYASHLAGRAFSKSYVGYVHAIAHSLGGKYNIPHGYANAVILPHVLKEYGNRINKKLGKIIDYIDPDNNLTLQEKASLFLNMLDDLENKLNIDKYISCINEEDIDEMAKYACKEANPLYPVPVLWDFKKMKSMYYKIKGE